MITPITATFPALNFPKEVDYPTQEDWAAFSAAAELNYGILSGTWSDKSEEFKAQTNNLALEIQGIGENAFNAISLDTIEDLATYTGTGLVMIKDINRGGTFVSKTEIEIDPNTGSLYEVNDGTVFAKSGGGFWVRQYSGAVNVKWFGANSTRLDNEIPINMALNVNKSAFIPYDSHPYKTSGSIVLEIGYSLKGSIENSESPGGTTVLPEIQSTSTDAIVMKARTSIKGVYINCINGLNAIRLEGAFSSLIENVSMRSLLNEGSYGVYTADKNTYDLKMTNCYVFKFINGLYLNKCTLNSYNCNFVENKTNVNVDLGYFNFYGGLIALASVRDIVGGYSTEGDFYSDYNCKIALNNVHLEANSGDTFERIKIGSVSGSNTDRVSINVNDCYIANNENTGIWLQVLSGTGSSFNVSSLSGVTASYTHPIIEVFPTAQNVEVKPIKTYPVNKSLVVIDNSSTSQVINQLSRYEEGVFTPVVIGSGVAGTATYSSQIGTYTVIGNTCIVNGYVNFTSHTGTGNLLLTLPIVPRDNGEEYSVGNCVLNNITYTSGASVALRVQSNNLNAQIKLSVNSVPAGIVAMDTDGYIMYSITYFV